MRSHGAPHCAEQTSLSAALVLESRSCHLLWELDRLQWCCWRQPSWRGVTELQRRDAKAEDGSNVGGKAVDRLPGSPLLGGKARYLGHGYRSPSAMLQ